MTQNDARTSCPGLAGSSSLRSSLGPFCGSLAECCSRYLTNPTCLKVTGKIIPGPFVLNISKDNTVFYLMVVGFILMPESSAWVKWCLVHPVPLAFRVFIHKPQEIWKLSIQKLQNKVLLSLCAEGGQMSSQSCTVPFTLSPRVIVMKRKIAVGLEGPPSSRTAIPGAPIQFCFLSDACQLRVAFR